MDGRVYVMLAMLSVLVFVGFIWQLRRMIKGQVILTSFQRRGLVLLALQVLIVTITYVWYNLDFVQHQGRYLFPALLPLSVSFAVGLLGLFSSEGSRWGAMAAIVFFGLVLVLGIGSGDMNRWALLISMLAVVILGLHSRYNFIPATALAIATLALMFLISVYALFGAIIPQLG